MAALSPGQIVTTLAPIVGKVGAAGIAGNLMQESSDNPASRGGGLAQWQGSRYTGLVKYAQARGLPVSSDQAALGYLAQDLKGPYSGLANQLRGAKDPATAATLFSNIYERPGTPMLGNRISYARQALGAPGGAPGSTSTLPTMPGQTVSTTRNVFNQAGYQQALARSIAGQYVAQSAKTDPYSAGAPKTGLPTTLGSNPLFASGALTTTTPNPASYVHAQTELQKLAGGMTVAMHPTGISGQAVHDAAGAGANRDAQKLLGMIHAVQGGSYNQGNHADIGESAAQVRAQGTDCSGLISWLMGPRGLGIWNTALATPQIANAPGMQAGRGSVITVWNNKQPGNAGHVFIQIGGSFFNSDGQGGIRQISASVAQNYIQHGSDGGTYQPLHPRGA